MKRVEMHLHTFPMSRCSVASAEDMVEKYYSIGFGGLVLTNHYSDAYNQLTGKSHERQMEEYVRTFGEFKAECEKRGMRAFFGAEVAVRAFYSEKMQALYSEEIINGEWSEYLIYGMNEEILLTSPRLCDMSQRELFEFCEEKGLLMLQAHPFRTCQRHSLKDLRYVHGLEINTNFKNITPLDGNREEIYRLCREHDLIAVAGGDIHRTDDNVRSCTLLPDDITTDAQLVEYLRRVKTPEIEILSLDGAYEPLTKKEN